MIVPRQLQVVNPGALEVTYEVLCQGRRGYSAVRPAKCRTTGDPGGNARGTAPGDDRLEPALETPAEADGDSVS